MTTPISVSRADAAAYLGVSEKTVDRAIKAGDLPVKFVGRKPLVPFPALVAWFESLPDEKPE